MIRANSLPAIGLQAPPRTATIGASLAAGYRVRGVNRVRSYLALIPCVLRKGAAMVTAFVLIKTAGRKPSEVAQQVMDIAGVAEVYSISGEWDVLAILRLAAYEQIAEVVPEQIAVVAGVAATTTILAFRAYNKQELEAAFDIGLS